MRPRPAATTGLVGLLLAVVLSIPGLGLGATVGVAGAGKPWAWRPEPRFRTQASGRGTLP